MADGAPVNYQQDLRDVMLALGGVHNVIEKHGLSRNLVHLVHLRASQINGCAYCVRMHTTDARNDGETNQRLDNLVVWSQTNDYADAERAAFAWTEALTTLDPSADLSPLRRELRKHFSDAEIGALTAEVAMINLWNRIQISAH